MKNFLRMLRYVRPYRSKIALGIVSAIGVSLLFTVSIGMLAPILQVITSPEGLNGWIYRANVENRLGVTLAQPDNPVADQAYSMPIIRKVKDDSPAQAAGLRVDDRISAIAGEPVVNLLAATETLAQTPPDQAVELTVGRGEQHVQLTVVLPRAPWHRRQLERLTGLLPAGHGVSSRMKALGAILLVLLAMTIVRNGLRYANDLLIQGSTIQAVMDIRCDVYHRLTSLPVAYFGQNGVNDAMSRVMSDTGQINTGMTTLFGKTIQEPIKATFCLVAALLLQWQVVVIGALGAPLSYMIIRKFGKQMRKAAKRALVGSARLLAVLEETLFGLRVVKAYTMEGYERRRFFRAHRKLLDEQLRMRKIDSAVSPLLEVLGFVGLAAAVMVATYFVLASRLDLKLLVAQLGLLAAMGDSMRKLSNVNNRMQQAEAASERVQNLLSAEPEPAGRDLPKIGRLSRAVRFENVSFHYPDRENLVVRNVTVQAKAGQVVAVVGPNGSGKTTLLSLLPRFYDATEGRITWDGQDINRVNLRSLRRQIGLVTQDAVIFADTVEANIRYGNKRISREQVVAAARQSFADEFIQQMPDGYDTVLGEHGTTLSGGQKQRIALARAILRDPSLLILDEAMSQVDAESEMKIQQVLDRFLAGRTAFVIAHRFSTVRQADQIVVMDAGQVVGVGRHEQLMADCPLYRVLYQTQFQTNAAPNDAVA